MALLASALLAFVSGRGWLFLASLSPALCLREGMASLASRSPALCLREGMASLASRSPAFSQVDLRSRALQLFFLPLFLSLRGISPPLGCMWHLKVSRRITNDCRRLLALSVS
ncbi:hypothetical protein Bca101_004182 [Brassica carinata]